MRAKALWFGVSLALVTVFAPFVGAQDPEQEDVRGAFLTTRPKAADQSTKATAGTHPNRRRPKVVAKNNPPQKDTDKPAVDSPDPGNDHRVVAQRLGLGMTLFMRDSNGLAVRVDPSHEFKKGDRVRVLLETNADGHLYVFNTTDGGEPVMIYPDPQLDEAGNFLTAHVPFEIPSSLSDEDRLRWFTFDEHAGTERLYFVFTREPLKTVPIEDDLLKFCGENKTQCAWHPEAELWTTLKKQMETPSHSNNVGKFGKAQTPAEQQGATRGIGLAKEDAEPTVVIMNASSGPKLLVTALELSHK